VIEEVGDRGVERIGLFEVREVTRLGNRDQLRARDARCISAAADGGVTVSSSPTTISVGT
jgi:hypothetical protein